MVVFFPPSWTETQVENWCDAHICKSGNRFHGWLRPIGCLHVNFY
jgi:hypothetical protein